MKENLTLEIELPKGVTAEIVGLQLSVKGAKGNVVRAFQHPRIVLKIDAGKIILHSINATKREKTIIYIIHHLEHPIHPRE